MNRALAGKVLEKGFGDETMHSESAWSFKEQFSPFLLPAGRHLLFSF